MKKTNKPNPYLTTSVRIEREVHKAIKSYCDKKEISFSSQVNQVLREFIKLRNVLDFQDQLLSKEKKAPQEKCMTFTEKLKKFFSI